MALSGMACSLSDLTALMETPVPAGPTAEQEPVVVIATPTPLPSELVAQADVEEQLVISVYARVGPAVVCNTARQQFGTCIGSGFVIDAEGNVVTNNHVAQAVPELLVSLAD